MLVAVEKKKDLWRGRNDEEWKTGVEGVSRGKPGHQCQKNVEGKARGQSS